MIKFMIHVKGKLLSYNKEIEAEFRNHFGPQLNTETELSQKASTKM